MKKETGYGWRKLNIFTKSRHHTDVFKTLYTPSLLKRSLPWRNGQLLYRALYSIFVNYVYLKDIGFWLRMNNLDI